MNMELTVKLKEALKTIDLRKSRNDALESALEKERDEHTKQPKKPSILLITDSNRRTITKPLRESLTEHKVDEITDIFKSRPNCHHDRY